MATQGLVTVVEDGAVVMKVVAGANGYNAEALGRWLEQNPRADGQAVYNHALAISFGSPQCLVVQTSADHCVVDPENDGVPSSYRDHFHEPRFNPRWEHGTADHVVVVER